MGLFSEPIIALAWRQGIAAGEFCERFGTAGGGELLKLATTPLGPGLLVAVELGLVIFSIYPGCGARWRQVKPG